MNFGRTIETKGDARFYLILGIFWVALAVWQIINLFRIPSVLEVSGSFGAIYIILTVALLAWSSWNTYDIGKNLLAYREKIKENA